MVIIAAGSALAIPFVLLHSKSDPGSPGSPNSPQSTGAIFGVNGSVVTTNNGSTFIYINNFGGDWAYDPTSPFSPGGKAQNWSPRIGNETWVWGSDVARGVNLGYDVTAMIHA
jgi:glucan 1,3-beta-glucosidase